MTERAVLPQVGAEVELHWVRADDDVALARCLARNHDPVGSFVIDEYSYADLRSRFSELGPDEPHTTAWSTSA